MPKTRLNLIATFLFLAALLGSPSPASAVTILSKESLSLNTKTKNDLAVSVYVLENSSWTKDAILNRLSEMNEALRTCGHEVAFVDYHRVSADFAKVRVDDLDQADLGDGMKRLSTLNPGDKNLRLYYFDEYLESFSSGGIFPVSIPENTRGVTQSLWGTAWFPFQTSARKQKRTLPYSEEGHELGHLLLQEGHDSSGTENILADNSKLRRNHFSAEQCKRFKIPAQEKLSAPCRSLRQELMPEFSRHYETYNQGHYMAQWCVRNSQNLFRALHTKLSGQNKSIYAVYAIHREDGSSLKPRMARWRAKSWSNHAFLIIDGLVLDQDFTDGPEILPLMEYLDKMWGEQAGEIRYQVREAAKIDDYTNLGVRRSFASGDFPIFDQAGLIRHFSETSCAR